jgi:asparagine N-glycosylation enzyme membrane subunit Stt3
MKSETKEITNKIKKFVLNKNVQIGFAIFIFLIILISSTSLRLANLDRLKDVTTGKYLPSDPDACYELRVAQTLLDKGNIKGIDVMRNPGLNVTFAQEMLPKFLVFSYKTLHLFGSSITLDKVDILYPVWAFAAGLIIFFLLCWYLSKSKIVAVIASALLAYSPSYLSRTNSGISSHESLGMPFMFLAMLIFAVSLKKFGKDWKQTIIWGILSGISFAFSFWSWSGASNFVLMIISLALLFTYFFGIEEEELDKRIKFFSFSVLLVISSVLIMPIFGHNIQEIYSRFTGTYGMLTLLIILFSGIDYFMIKYKSRVKFAESKYRILYSFLISIILGLIGLTLLGKNPLFVIKSIYTQILFPMGLGRVGLTVAYYAQPYISDLISQYSAPIFWLFVFGMIFMGIETSKSIKSLKHKLGFVVCWTIAIVGMMFSRTSASSIFNGTNFISQVTYILSLGLFLGYFVWLYFKDKFSMDSRSVFLFSWMFVMLLSTRSAVRVIFVIYCFVAFAVAYALFNFWQYSKKLNDSTAKTIFYIATIISVLIVLISLFGNPINNSYGSYKVAKYSAMNMGPIADQQWQLAMSWVRDNTNKEDVFAHWWDYGYQIQLIADRTTVLDGGNYNVYWNHMLGRYILTSQNPEASLSFLKTHNVSYFIVDPTDLGKYGAYSKIGSDDNWDRFSAPNVMVVEDKQTKETANGTVNVYTGGSFVDEDINYNGIFLPGPTYDNYGNADYKSYIAGILLEVNNNKGNAEIKQPQAVFVYNSQQYRVPIRYVYFNGKMLDFKTGINATFRIMTQVTQTSDGKLQINALGSGIYLSPRVSKGFFAKMYLMDDPFNEYPTFKKAVFQDDYYVNALNQQGANVGDMIYLEGFRGPLKIWKVEYPSNVKTNSEFMATSGEYGAQDNLSFVY